LIFLNHKLNLYKNIPRVLFFLNSYIYLNYLLNILKNVSINKTPRGKEKPSDHTPIEIELA